MMLFKRLLSITALLTLAACGGGGGSSGTPAFGPGASAPLGGGGNTAFTGLDLQLSQDTVANTGTDSVTATVTAVDANRNAVAGVSVSVSADNNAIVTIAGAGASNPVTDANGKLVATISIGSDRSLRDINVTATSGGITRTAVLKVVASQATATASDLAISLSSPTVSSSGTETVTATITAVDSNRNTVSGIPVTVSVDQGATASLSGSTTGADGTVKAVIGIGNSRANRSVLVTATSGQLTRKASIQIVGSRLVSSALPAVLSPGDRGVVQYRLTDASGNAIADTPINITGAGAVQSTGSTGINGEFDYNYTAAAAGTLNITATAAGISNVTTVVVQSGPGVIPAVPADLIVAASVSANPSVVPVNSSTTTANRAELRALFVSPSNAPIRNVRVRFDLAGDANAIGGSLTTNSTLVYSDANGIATSAYLPGSRFSPTDGLTVRACWSYTDFAEGTCPHQVTTTLTVIADPLSVTIGTDELIVLDDLVYIKRFVVQVNDSSGLAKPDVLVSPLLDLPRYLTGQYSRPADKWVQNIASVCDNEDLNRNGVLQTLGDLEEDGNDNHLLEPRKADVAVAYEGSNRTNAAGQIFLRITYPRNVAGWDDYVLTVSAGVAGTEGRARFAGRLPVPQTALTAEAVPAFGISPYGAQTWTLSVVPTPMPYAGTIRCILATIPVP